MEYVGTVIRPPSEADSIIIQATIGCPHNRCSFCGAYRNVRFRVRSASELDHDLAFAQRYCHRQKRVFLADGDSLAIPQTHLVWLLERIRTVLPWVSRVSSYARADSIRAKSDRELQVLRHLGLARLYLGIESGDDTVLTAVRKAETAQSLGESCSRVTAAGFFLSTTVILGLAGTIGSSRHADLTAHLLNRISPNQIAALSLMTLEGTPLGNDVLAGRFHCADPVTVLNELRILVNALSCDRIQFMANHASNYLRLSGRLQRDKPKLLAQIDQALSGTLPLFAEAERAL